MAQYSMPSVFTTSTMKSPPEEVCVTGSFSGSCVSSAICVGPGGSVLRGGLLRGVLLRGVLLRGVLGAATCALAAAGVSATAPARPAPLRKLRRATSGEFRRFGMGALQAVVAYAGVR